MRNENWTSDCSRREDGRSPPWLWPIRNRGHQRHHRRARQRWRPPPTGPPRWSPSTPPLPAPRRREPPHPRGRRERPHRRSANATGHARCRRRRRPSCHPPVHQFRLAGPRRRLRNRLWRHRGMHRAEPGSLSALVWRCRAAGDELRGQESKTKTTDLVVGLHREPPRPGSMRWPPPSP